MKVVMKSAAKGVSSRMKILIVDDHALFREGLCHLLKKLDQQIQIHEAYNADIALSIIANHPDLDLVLLDLNMPGKNGFTVLNSAIENFPLTPIVVLSASQDHNEMQRVIDMGAMGFIPKETTGDVMISALQLILAGGIYVPPTMINQTDNSQTLTPRQLEVLKMLAEGLSNKKIAKGLGIAEATIKMHITSIFKCLCVSNRTQAAMAAQTMGLSF